MINLKEIIIAIVITILVFWGTLLSWSPFNFVIQFGNKISDSYAEKVEIPNIPDAEKLSLNDFALKAFNVSYTDLVLSMEKYCFDQVDENSTVLDFCKLNGITPEEFYISLKYELSISGSAEITDSPNITLYNSYFGDKKTIL